VIQRIWFFVQERAPRDRLDLAMRVLREDGGCRVRQLAGGARWRPRWRARARARRDGIARSRAQGRGDRAGAAALRATDRVLGTLGNNAPFIGLFGTVLGIIRAFHDLAGNTVQGTQAVMSGIAEALVATGVGLLVALPAVATYNAFIRRVETTSAGSEALAHRILAHIKAVPAKPAPAPAKLEV
jgi:biopolymer transport protein ExbB/TolQ